MITLPTKKQLPLLLLGFVIAASFFYYLINAHLAPMSLGFDEILMHWPIGAALSEASIQEFPRILMASFFLEDHLYPLGSIVSYLIYSDEYDPIQAISITTKLLYVAWIIATIFLLKLLYSDKTKIVLAIGLIVSNQALFFHNSTHWIVTSLVILFSVLTIFFIAKYISTKRTKFLICAYLFLILGTFSFEIFFASYSLILLFSIYKIHLSDDAKKNKLLILVKIILAIAMALIPYLIFHYIQFSTILPSSRLGIETDGDVIRNGIVVGAKIINDIFYGMPRYFFLNFSQLFWVIVPLGLFTYLIRKKIALFSNQNSNALIFASFFTLPVCMYTGRYWPGMWSFVGLMMLIAFASIIVETLKNFKINNAKREYILSLIILIFLSFNLINPPHQVLSEHTKYIKNTSSAGYKVLNSAANKITIVKLPDAKYLEHPVAFWTGNQIYHGNNGLSYFKDQNVMHMKDAYIETYKNPQNKNFSYYENFLNTSKNDSMILFKNRNSFFTFDNDRSLRRIFRAVSFSGSDNKVYDIYYPQFIKNSIAGKRLKVELTLDTEVLDVDEVFYGGKAVINYEIDGNKVIFSTEDQTTPNQISIISSLTGKSMIIKLIEIYSSANIEKNTSTIITEKTMLPSFSAGLMPCAFELSSQNLNIYTTLSPMMNLEINTFQPISDTLEELEISYWSFHLDQTKRLVKNNLKFKKTASSAINCIQATN